MPNRIYKAYQSDVHVHVIKILHISIDRPSKRCNKRASQGYEGQRCR